MMVVVTKDPSVPNTQELSSVPAHFGSIRTVSKEEHTETQRNDKDRDRERD